MAISARLQTAMPLLVRKLDQLERSAVDTVGAAMVMAVAFPDEGAWKRFHVDLDRWPAITCVKVREGERRVVSIKDGEVVLPPICSNLQSHTLVLCCAGDPRGCHVVIVDDLVQTGGTLIECAKV